MIDSTYFTGEILIPGASADAQLTQAIEQYEKEILVSLLGYKLYKLLIADLSDGEPQSQKYIDLMDGAEFTHSFEGQDITLKWEGLRNNARISLIAYYVYYKYVERHLVEYHGTGLSMMPEGKDWLRVNPTFKLVNAWDRMRELYGKLPAGYKNYYPHPVSADSLPGVFDMNPSAYNFLWANKDDYPDWLFTPQWNINAFGI